MTEQNKERKVTFTDEDLKRWKYKYCSGDPSERDEEVEALLARLEAAEEVIKAQDQYDQTFDVQEDTGYSQINQLESAKRAWQKISGK